MNTCIGATRDLTHLFTNERRKWQQKAKCRGLDEKTLLRERFKPLKPSKTKVKDDDEENRRLRSSTLSDEQSLATSGSIEFELAEERNIQNAVTKSSSNSSLEETKALPPMYVDI